MAERLGEGLADTFDVLLDMEWSGSHHGSIKVLDDVDAVLVVVGPGWLELLEEDPRFVRSGEKAALLVAALDRKLPIVIVLVDGASLPVPGSSRRTRTQRTELSAGVNRGKRKGSSSYLLGGSGSR